jgi:hypothetical protein
MKQIIFKRIDKSEVGRIESENSGTVEERILNYSEEIIGIYGGYDMAKTDSIGIIVWTPP